MKRIIKIVSCIMMLTLFLTILPCYDVNAASLSRKSVQVAVANKAVIEVYYNYDSSKVSWSSSNSNIKIIKTSNTRAVIKGVKQGKSVLTAKIGSRTYKCKVVVTKKEIAKYKLSNKVVFYESDSYSEGGVYYAYVEVVNTGNVPLYLDGVSFDLEDSRGHLVTTDSHISEAPDFIYPGEKGYFYNQFGTSVSMSKAEFDKLKFVPHIKVVKATNSLPADYKLYDVSMNADATFDGKQKIVGKLKNNTKKDLSYIYLQAFFYDCNGKIIGISGSNMTDIPAGREKSFSISTLFAGVQAGKTITSYRVIARGTYYQF